MEGAEQVMQEHTTGEARARRLETVVEGLLQSLEGLDGDALYQEPGEGEWSLMKALAHVAEILPYWARQARDVAEGDAGQPFGRTHEDPMLREGRWGKARLSGIKSFGRTHEDPDRIAAIEEHARDPLEDMLPRLRSGLAEAAATLRAIPAEGWARTGRHARRGEMTVVQIVDLFLIEHVEEHAKQVQAVMDSLAGY